MTSRSPLPLVITVGLILFVAAACTSSNSGPSLAPQPSAAASSRVVVSAAPPSVAATSVAPSIAVSASAPAVLAASASGSPSGPPSITVIDWGDIWDALPASFPQYPGAHPTVTGGGPASATLDIPADAVTASAWFQAALKAAGFAIVGANGPREDGSYDITATKGATDCQTEVSLAPLGTTTTATIYLAAACPFN